MKYLQKLPLILILIGLTTTSCRDEIKETEASNTSVKEAYLDADEQEIVLGDKIENPYSVENMQQAYQNIMKSKDKSSKTLQKTGETIEISTNHHYVRFWCTSAEDKEKLTSLDIQFSEFPLDREIEEEGDFFIEEDFDTETFEGAWVYTSLLEDFDYASLGLTYELLEDLFLFEESQGEDIEEDDGLLAKATDAQISFYEALEKEAFRITGNLEKELKKNKDNNLGEKCWFFCRGRTQPKGTLKVYNTATGGTDPVVGVKVRTFRWFVWGRGYTNENGYYKINKKYRGDPWYSIDFYNPSNKIKIYSTWLSLSDATYRAWTESKRGYNKTFYTNSYGWRFSTVNNAVVKYRKYCRAYGIGTFNSKMRINVTSGSGKASTPMLRHTYGFIGFNSRSDVSNFFLNNSPLGFLANSWIGYLLRLKLLPDIWIQGNARQGTDGVYYKVFHEMAHSSHFAKVGGAYWAKYISYILTYGAYGDGTGRNAGYCGVGEMWGNYFSFILLEKEFVSKRYGNSWKFEDWYNPGFLGDVANIPDVTISEIYQCLTASTTTFQELIRKLKTKTTQHEKIDAAFNSYTDWP